MAPSFQFLSCLTILLHAIRVNGSYTGFLGLGEDECGSNVVRPNIVFIMLDDLGFGDLSGTGSTIPTPHMDDIYANSIRLQRHYVHLAGSPSRTQFLTGRAAMNMGFGTFEAWGLSEAVGIPIGQPTLANWLSEFGSNSYTTYGAGKWNLGYATDLLLPQNKGFDHFYGFYQNAIDYDTKQSYDPLRGQLALYDLFDDAEPSYDGVASAKNSMELYAAKIDEWLGIEGDAVREAEERGVRSSPFFLYAALQSLHEPFPIIDEFVVECIALTIASRHFLNRNRYCELMLLTDRIVGGIVERLRVNELWENTLLVLTTDNGGNTQNGASNFPLRGGKGEYFDGNMRTIAAVSGGIVASRGLANTERTSLFSNLDWTPTLLDFAGFLPCIAPGQYSWDGQSQYDLLLHGDDAADATNTRSELILNIDDREVSSAVMLLERDGALFKYIKTDVSKTGTEDDMVDGAYLFSLRVDESESVNLLSANSPGFDDYPMDEQLARDVADECEEILARYVSTTPLFTPSLSSLHAKLDLGDPTQIADGEFIRPFMSAEEYTEWTLQMLETEGIIPGISNDAALDPHAQQVRNDDLGAMYLTPWIAPKPIPGDTSFINLMVALLIIIVVLVFVCLAVMWYCKRDQRRRKNGYTALPQHGLDEKEAHEAYGSTLVIN